MTTLTQEARAGLFLAGIAFSLDLIVPAEERAEELRIERRDARLKSLLQYPSGNSWEDYKTE